MAKTVTEGTIMAIVEECMEKVEMRAKEAKQQAGRATTEAAAQMYVESYRRAEVEIQTLTAMRAGFVDLFK